QVLDDELISAWTAGPGKPGLASAKDVPRLVRAVRAARQTSDTVVVFLHCGVELEQCPSSDQRRLAKQLVAAGADVVVGGHAHRVQGAGRMGRALVGYGLGNFVWYGTSELSTQTGVLVVTVESRRVLGYRWVPARIVDGVPRPLSGPDRSSELANWRSLRSCTGLTRRLNGATDGATRAPRIGSSLRERHRCRELCCYRKGGGALRRADPS